MRVSFGHPSTVFPQTGRDVDKDWTHNDNDKDKAQAFKVKDTDKEYIYKDKNLTHNDLQGLTADSLQITEPTIAKATKNSVPAQ